MATDKKDSGTVSFEECLRRVLTGDYECRHAPEKSVEAGEVVLGTLENPTARSMYSLWLEMKKGAEKYTESLPESLPREKKDEVLRIRCEIHRLNNRINCAKSIFWEFVYCDFPKGRDPHVSVGIRENWTVVIFKSSQPSFLDFFGGDNPFND